MARKAKKRMHKMPPLSFVDQLIYWCILLFLITAYFFLLFGPIWLRQKIAFADPAVIAVEDNVGIFWGLIPLFTFILTTAIPLLLAYQDRKPIFGKHNFKYGPPAWPKVYPLFMKNKPPVFVSERKKKSRKQIAVFLVVLLLVSFIPLPLSLYRRACLQNNGSIVRHNACNQQTQDFAPGAFSEIVIKAYRYHTKGSYKPHYSVQMRFTTSTGKHYSFELDEFRKEISPIVAMVNIKNRYNPSIIRYEGAEKLDLVVHSRKLSQEDTQLLYQLFGQS